MKILILNGPNLNLLGTREPAIYGKDTLADIENSIQTLAKSLGYDVTLRQSNSESQLVTWVQEACEQKLDALIINPAALGHTSVALRDAVAIFQGQKVEVHLSNTYKREIFRKNKLLSPVIDGVIEGFGAKGYLLAIKSLD